MNFIFDLYLKIRWGEVKLNLCWGPSIRCAKWRKRPRLTRSRWRATSSTTRGSDWAGPWPTGSNWCRPKSGSTDWPWPSRRPWTMLRPGVSSWTWKKSLRPPSAKSKKFGWTANRNKTQPTGQQFHSRCPQGILTEINSAIEAFRHSSAAVREAIKKGQPKRNEILLFNLPECGGLVIYSSHQSNSQ